jgi:hypothetical protein
MQKQWVWLSTLNQLADKLPIEKEVVDAKFSRFSQVKSATDTKVEITAEEKNWIDSLCKNIPYPACRSCQKPLCSESKERCHCLNEQSFKYQQEYDMLVEKNKSIEKTLSHMMKLLFRPSRNAYGEVGIVSGGAKLIAEVFGSVLAIGSYALLGFILTPAICAGAYVYYRDKKEELEYISDAQAELMEKKITIFCQHKAIVELREAAKLTPKRQLKNAINAPLPSKKSPLFLSENSFHKPKPYKEKRGILGNPISHLIGSGLTAWSLLKTTASLCAFIPGGIAVTLTIVGISLGVGAYFAYKRQKQLKNKIAFEQQMALLSAQESDINLIKKNISTQITTPAAQPQLSHLSITQQLTQNTQLLDEKRSSNSTPLSSVTTDSETPDTASPKRGRSASLPHLHFLPGPRVKFDVIENQQPLTLRFKS